MKDYLLTYSQLYWFTDINPQWKCENMENVNHRLSKTQNSKSTPSKNLYESLKHNICHLFENSSKGVNICI